MNELTVFENDGTLYTDSREVARMVDKQHKELLRDIRKYIEYLGQSNFAPSDFFIEATYINGQNKVMPRYDCTKKGCDLIAHKLTGEKGVLFTAAYVTAFEAYQEASKRQPLPAGDLISSLGTIASYLRVMRRIAIDNGCSPREIAQLAYEIHIACGVPVPRFIVTPSNWEQTALPGYEEAGA